MKNGTQTRFLLESETTHNDGHEAKGNQVYLHAHIEHTDCITFLKSLPDESVDIIITDPAYSGMNQHLQLGHGRIVGHYSSTNSESKWFEEFHDDVEGYRVFLSECKRVLKNDRHIYIMFDSFSLLTLGSIVREFFDVKNLVTWDKFGF